MSQRSTPHPLFTRYVALAERRNGALLLALLALMGVAVGFTTRLELRTDVSKLLPESNPAVTALRKLAGRQKSGANLVLLIHGPDAAANLRFADALQPRLGALVPSTFSEIQWHPDRDVPAFIAANRWLYAPLDELQKMETLVDRAVAKREQPGFVDLEGDPDDELRRERDRLQREAPQPPPDTPYFSATVDGESYLGVLLWKRMEGLAARGDHLVLARVQAAVRALDPARFGPVRVEYSGGIAQAIDEQNGIRDDLTLSTLLCTVCVLAAIYSYFRRVALLWVIGAPAVLGLLLALWLAALTIHYLNINTAFLISIILGNGINSPIILLGRYGEERRLGRAVAPALAQALTRSLSGIATAVGAAGVAYACLLGTNFRGMSQFGLIGGAGMFFVGLMTFVLVPPLVIFGERRWPGALTPPPNLWRGPFAALGGLAARRPLALAGAALAVVVLLAAPALRFLRDPLEWNMEKIRTEATAAQRLWPKLTALGIGKVGAGYAGNNGVLLVDRPEQADVVAAALRRKDAALGPRHVLKSVRTLSSFLPTEQPEKLELLARLRRKLDLHAALFTGRSKAQLDEWRPPDGLHALTVDELPRMLRDAFTEVDGQRGRLVGVNADEQTYSDWNGHDLLRLAQALQVDALGQHWVVSSPATIVAGMLQAVIEDGPKVTGAALLAVGLLVMLMFGVRGSLPVLASIAVGVVWMLGLCGLGALKLNFMNFVALPITLGVGADYAANIWARLRHDGTARLQPVIADTGSAVALCSLTTIIGYSTLLLSHNRALRSFGLLADVGELTCLTAALLVLPALARLFTRPGMD